MPAKSKLQLKSDDPERYPVMLDIVSRRVGNRLGVQLKLTDPGKDAVAERMAKAKKPFELFYVFDKGVFSVELRIGAKTDVLGKLSIAAQGAKRRAILTELELMELVTKADIEAFDKANPEPVDLDRARSEKRDLEYELQGDVADRKTIAAWKTYDNGGRAGGYDVSALLKLWIQDKKPSWTHYIEFVDDIAAGKDDKQIFDRYVKDGAQYPVNLPPAQQGPLEKAMAAGKKPDFGPARGLIVKLIDTKFIPLFKKDRLALYDKSMKEIALKLKTLNKQLVGK